MRAILQAITEELQRLKADGEQTVVVSEETLVRLRALVAAQGGKPVGAFTAHSPGADSATRSPAPGAAAKTAFANWQPKSETRAEPSRAAPVASASLPRVPAAAATPVVKLPPPPVVTLPEGEKAARWAALHALAASDPVCVSNVRAGKKIAFGSGSLEAKIFFVGDAPGAEEELAGEPFVGPSGQLLTKMIAGMGLKREDVFICNVLCWRPAVPVAAGAEQLENRAPTTEEMGYCLPYLRAAVELVQPELIVALGGAAAQGLLGAKFTKLADARSQWHDFAGHPVMVTYHPSYLLRSNSTKSKRAVWDDLLKVMERGELPISPKQRGYFL